MSEDALLNFAKKHTSSGQKLPIALLQIQTAPLKDLAPLDLYVAKHILLTLWMLRGAKCI